MREPGEGERAAKAHSRRFWGIIAALGIGGGIAGFLHAMATDGDLTGSLPAVSAIAIALLLVVTITIGSWYFFRSVDELELRDNLWASIIALYAYCTAYPVWYLLWKGGVTIEPSHELMFLGTMVVMCLSYLWMKIRS